MSTATTAPSELGVPVKEGTLTVGGLDVRWYDSVEEPTDKAPVVLVHGTGGSTRRHFSFLFPMLTTEQRVVSLDLATPEGDPAQGPEQLAAQVLAVLDEVLPGRQVTLVGYSLGAVVAATAAARRPESIGALVLCAGWLKTDTQQTLRNDVWHALRSDQDAFARYHVFCAFSPSFLGLLGPDELGYMFASARNDDDVAQQMKINRAVDLSRVVPHITSPTLVVAGTDDIMTPKRQGKRLFGAIEDARYTEVTAGHAMIAERGAEIVHLINTFSAHPHRYPAGSVLPPRRP
ncbi:alpha/beta fold hydrolase [Blastococcus sp. SYSU D00695]